MPGVTDKGFERRRFPDILEELRENIKAEFGAAANVSESSVFGKLTGIMAQTVANLWELAEDVYNSFSPHTASGIALDHAVALTGIARLPATESTAWGVLRLDPNTTVNPGKRIKVVNSEPAIIFMLTNSVTSPDPSDCYGAWISIPVVEKGSSYRIHLKDHVYAHVAQEGEDARAILTALASLINGGPQATIVEAAVLSREDTLRIYPKTEGKIPNPLKVSVSVIGPGQMSIIQTGGLGYLICTETGPKVAYKHTLTDILDPVPGWLEFDNLADAQLGRDVESDADLRLRREASIHIANGGTVEAIRTALLSLEDVKEALVRENVTDKVDEEGKPPHSIQCLVDAPSTEEINKTIAETIWKSKPAGIQTYGTEGVEVFDSQNFPHMIYFTRPTSVRILMKVSYHIYSEEQLPENAEDVMRQVLADHALTNQPIGKDMIPTRYFGPIYENVSGIDQLRIAVRKEGGTWTELPIPISWTERASLSPDDIEFEVIA